MDQCQTTTSIFKVVFNSFGHFWEISGVILTFKNYKLYFPYVIGKIWEISSFWKNWFQYIENNFSSWLQVQTKSRLNIQIAYHW